MRNPALRQYDKVKDRLSSDKELLEEVLKYFDMSDCTLFEAMHLVFGHAIPLPGEAQKIDRVMEAFGKEYYRQAKGGVKVGNNEDSFFILAFAVIMLNSDLHNPSVKRRMSCQQFRRNLEGAITLSKQDATRLFTQVLRCEMVEGSKAVAQMNKTVWLCRAKIGWV
jgi:Sec7-like guanine-nucleotide exchange factor